MKDTMSIRRNNGQLYANGGHHKDKHLAKAITRVTFVREGFVNVELNERFVSIPIVMIKLSPITGLSHQLRFQLFQRQLPIIGDHKYNTLDSLYISALLQKEIGVGSQLMLHSESIELEDGFVATAPLPTHMETLIGAMSCIDGHFKIN